MTNGGRSRITARSDVAWPSSCWWAACCAPAACSTGTSSAATAAGTHATFDNGITPASVPTLAPSLTGTTGGAIFSTPAVASGVAYVTSDDGRLDAFDATGTTNCTGVPNTCTPLWTASIEPSGRHRRHRAARSRRRQPWPTARSSWARPTASSRPSTRPARRTAAASPRRARRCGRRTTGGAIYSSPDGVGHHRLHRLHRRQALRLRRHRHDQLQRPPKTCTPLWTATTGGAVDDTPAVSGSTVYVGSTDGKLYAFDATGATNCVSAVCSPLWTAPTGGPITFSSPAVDGGGAVFVGSTDGKLYAFDANGVNGCTAGVCSPLWTMATGGSIVSSPAVFNNIAYVGSSDHKLYAVDATGVDRLLRVAQDLLAAVDRDHRRRRPLVAGRGRGDGLRRIRRPPRRRLRRRRHDELQRVAQDLHAAVDHHHGRGRGQLAHRRPGHGLLRLARPLALRRQAVGGAAGDLPGQPALGAQPVPAGERLPSCPPPSPDRVAPWPSSTPSTIRTPRPTSAVYRAQYGLPPCTTANGCFKKLNQNGRDQPATRRRPGLVRGDLARRRHGVGHLPALPHHAGRGQDERDLEPAHG